MADNLELELRTNFSFPKAKGISVVGIWGFVEHVFSIYLYPATCNIAYRWRLKTNMQSRMHFTWSWKDATVAESSSNMCQWIKLCSKAWDNLTNYKLIIVCLHFLIFPRLTVVCLLGSIIEIWYLTLENSIKAFHPMSKSTSPIVEPRQNVLIFSYSISKKDKFNVNSLSYTKSTVRAIFIKTWKIYLIFFCVGYKMLELYNLTDINYAHGVAYQYLKKSMQSTFPYKLVLPSNLVSLKYFLLLSCNFRPLLTIYRMRAIISRGLYIFYPPFENYFFVFKEVFWENSSLMYG